MVCLPFILGEIGIIMAQSFKKLRLSLISSCNQSCFYCREGNNQLRKNECSPAELIELCGTLCELGIEEIRLTGGEPLLYPHFEEVLKGLGKLPLKKLALTTNGVQLSKFLPLLKEHKCLSLNVSLDSLDPQKFLFITKTNSLPIVLKALEEAKELGFSLKTNTVLMRGINDEEIENFIQFSATHHIQVRFLELMRLGQVYEDHQKLFLPYTEILNKLKTNHLVESMAVPTDSTAQLYTVDKKATLGFIASETTPFCGDCSRLRMDSSGELRACLFEEGTVNLRGKNKEELSNLLKELLCQKPLKRGLGSRTGMNTIGG